MTDRRFGLGRGLGALIPSARPADEPQEPGVSPGAEVSGGPAAAGTGGYDQSAVDAGGGRDPAQPDRRAPGDADGAEIVGLIDGGARFAELDPTQITTNARQPRQVFDEDAHDELVHSVREVGVLQPVVVRPIPGPGERRYELVMGERRWRAAQAAGLPTIPAIVRHTADDVMLRDALLENLHRAQLNPLEEAAAYDQLLRDFGCTQDELAERIGRSRPQISNTIRLLRLPPGVQRRLAAGVLTAGHARALLGLPDAAAQERLAQRIVAEGLSVRTVEEVVAVGETAGGGHPVTRSRRPVAPALVDLAERLSGRYETRVKVDLGRRRGRITVEFGSIADLERIVALMDPITTPGDAPRTDPERRPSTEAPFTPRHHGAAELPGPKAHEAGHWAHVPASEDAVDAGFVEGLGTDEDDPPSVDPSPA
ncbi:MAG: ParB/RepB/Spo0J family partition protein [Sporichthyaceae bacterium]|nr:ParB/RepB/Spo0J family partition protein [Sporichthyaceae bacterium]